MMMSSPDLRPAVRSLRLALKKTQTEFGALIGKTLPTVQRYENLVPPKGSVLTRLANVAHENGLEDYARLFRLALAAEMGQQLGGPAKVIPTIEFRNDEERLWAAATLLSMRLPEFAEQAKEAKKALRTAYKLVKTRIDQGQSQVDQVIEFGRLATAGKSASEIANAMKIPESLVTADLARPGARNPAAYSDTKIMEYTVLLSASVTAGNNEDIARAVALPMLITQIATDVAGGERTVLENKTAAPHSKKRRK